MSTRAIASAVRTGKRQVDETLKELGSESPPSITGTDGKTYGARERKPFTYVGHIDPPRRNARSWPCEPF
jgi:hypothetical protein